MIYIQSQSLLVSYPKRTYICAAHVRIRECLFGKNAHLNSILSSLSLSLSAVLHHKVHIVSELLDGVIMCVCLR